MHVYDPLGTAAGFALADIAVIELLEIFGFLDLSHGCIIANCTGYPTKQSLFGLDEILRSLAAFQHLPALISSAVGAAVLYQDLRGMKWQMRRHYDRNRRRVIFCDVSPTAGPRDYSPPSPPPPRPGPIVKSRAVSRAFASCTWTVRYALESRTLFKYASRLSTSLAKSRAAPVSP